MKNDDEINFDEEIPYIPYRRELIETELKLNNTLPKKLKRINMSELNLYGVENLKKVATALTKIINAGVASYSDDGKITFGDIGHFIKIIPDVISAIPSIKCVKPEITDKLTENEILELRYAITDSIELRNELDTEFLSQIIELLALVSRMVTNRTNRKKENDDKQ